MTKGTKTALIVIAIVAGIMLIGTILAAWGIYKFTSNIIEEVEEAEVVVEDTTGGATEAVVEIVDEIEEETEEAETEDEVETDTGTVSEPDADGMRTYSNTTQQVTFSFPETFDVTDEIVRIIYDDGTEWFRVTLENEDGDSFYIETNPDGYGPFFPDTKFLLSGEDGVITTITEEEQEVTEYNDDGRAEFTASTDESLVHCFIYYFADDNSEDHLEIFRSVLQSLDLS